MAVAKFAKVNGIPVEVISTGHFPSSVIVKLPNGNQMQVEFSDLQF